MSHWPTTKEELVEEIIRLESMIDLIKQACDEYRDCPPAACGGLVTAIDKVLKDKS